MFVVRPITQNDAEAFIDIAYHANIGMTSMPRNRHLLLERLATSEHSFAKQIVKPENEKYLFVIEDTDTGTIGGTCGIVARERHEIPLYYYRIDHVEQKVTSGHANPNPKPIPILRTVHYYDSPSELCSLFLTPEFRQGGTGRLLSLSRLLFIASFPQRFDKMLYANLRGYIDPNNVSYFWEGIGRHFYDTDLTTLMHLRDEEAIDIASVLPEYPIYIDLLPKDVQEAIGKVHHETRPALTMLAHEGFQHTDEIDPIDGGPIIEAETAELRTVKSSVVDRIAEITDSPDDNGLQSSRYILSNNRLNFRACYGTLQHRGHHGLAISQETANALELRVGDLIRYVSPIGIT